MANKGAIRFLAILLAVICGYYLIFTVKAVSVRKDAEKFANGDQAKYNNYLDSMKNQEVLSFPASYTYNDVQKREINLGLDLRGGVNVTLEISLKDILIEMSGDPEDSTFIKAIELADEMQLDAQDNYVNLFADALKEVDSDALLIDHFYTSQVIEEVGQEASDDEVIDFLLKRADDAIAQSFQVLRVRVNTFGIAQPNIQQIGNTGKVEVELPGMTDPDRAIGLLAGSANLQFWDVAWSSEATKSFGAINEKLKQVYDWNATTEEVVEEDPLLEGEDSIDVVADLPELEKGEPLDILYGGDAGSFAQSFPSFASQNYSFVGSVKVKDTAQVNEYLNHPEVKNMLPRGIKFLWENVSDTKNKTEGLTAVRLYALKVLNADGSAPLEGEIIRDAKQDFDERQSPIVSLTMTADAAAKWAEMTGKAVVQENHPSNRHIAIVLDDLVYSAPQVNNKIDQGRTQITVGGEVEEAKLLATVLKAGRFPAPVKVVEQSVVGPSLGQEAIQTSFTSFLIALLAVLVYMAFYYSKAGLVANIALVVNMFFIVGVLASFPTISLTLPGLAGIVLTIGMSVDANVLIYERIREELDAGKGLKLAIKDGYQNAYTAILDANITSFVTGLILWYFGSGPILGFAKTLVIGILTSLFSAIFITRLILEGMMAKKKDIDFVSKTTKSWFQNTSINFVQSRRKYYMLSAVIILAGIISMFTLKFDLGTDFEGGRSYVVRFDDSINAHEVSSDIANALNTHFEGLPEVKATSGVNDLVIKTNFNINSTEENAGVVVEKALYEGVKPFYKDEISFEEFRISKGQSDEGKLGMLTSKSVGPTIADDIKAAAFESMFIALLFIFLYVVARFRKWQFGLGALVAIFHDVLIVLSLFSLGHKFLPISLEINQAFIAAILTVVGYSINDTVVVFDRIREYLSLNPNKDLQPVMNKALNSTLSRTFNTSITILVVLLMILLFGASSIKGFAFALLVGVVAGTYSSLCVATPIVIDFVKKKKE